MQQRIVVAGFFHETHTFLKGRTPRADFTAIPPEALLAAGEGPGQIDGAMLVAKTSGWDVVPGPYWHAIPSGRVANDVFEAFWEALAPLLPGADGLYLDLHGAMVCESFPDAEGELLRRIRAVTGVPVAGALDLHGNITDAMSIENAVFVAYRQNPHTDVQAAATRAAQFLDRVLTTGERPQIVRVQPPIVWPPTGTATADEPMHTLEAMARQLEAAHPELLTVNVFAGFSFADLPECGVSFQAVTVGDPHAAQERLHALADAAWQLREKGLPIRTPLEEALPPSPGTQRVPGERGGPLLLVEPADNVGGGAPGDCTAVLEALLAAGVQNAGVCLCDPEAVAALWDVPVGETRTLGVGGKSGEIGATTPVTMTITKVSQSDGAYELEDRHSHNAMYGLVQHLGPTVVARSEKVTLLLTTRKAMPMDRGLWSGQGIDPRGFAYLNIKAAVAHRQAFDPIASASVTLESPGPCRENLALLPFEKIRHPIWPLDREEFEGR